MRTSALLAAALLVPAASQQAGGCVDTDNGATDSDGEPCAKYTQPNNGAWDDSDFTSGLMCCAAGGGVHTPAQSATISVDSPDVEALPMVGATFSIVEPIEESGVCCASEFFERMMMVLEMSPSYRQDPAEADIVFVRLDTLRICMWPQLQINGEAVSCNTEKAKANAPPEGTRYECSFCCRFGPDNYAATVQHFASRYGSNKTFVYFKNSWDNRYDCSEFRYAKVMAASLPATVRFVGVQLQQSQLNYAENLMDTNEYPIRGVNLLMPLLPDKQDLVEDPDSRWACNPRKYVASFSGCMTNPVRKKILEFKDNEGYHIFRTDSFGGQDPEGYEEVLLSSTFAFAPGGDEHYSFRLTEVLAAGAIPIVIDDDYVVPYGATSMQDWALFVKEADVWMIPAMVDSITEEQRCEMKRFGAKIWNKAKDLDSTVEAMIQALWDTRLEVLGAGFDSLSASFGTSRESSKLVLFPEDI